MKSNSTDHDATMGIGTSTGNIIESDLWFADKYGKNFNYCVGNGEMLEQEHKGIDARNSVFGLHGGDRNR